MLEEELPGTQVLVVSNREPYIHNRATARSTCKSPRAAWSPPLEPVMRACGGTWIAHGSGSADRETVDAHDHIAVPPSAPAYTLRRIWLTEEEQEGYYYGFANEGLWPLCHIAFVRPVFREQDWQYYVKVNERFADAVVQEATQDDPIVLVQDYHFALLPRMIRDRLPRATIITFWHIPWPNSETFSICPWREQIIDGLLGSTILGFHTQFHCNNFLEATDRFIESRIDREHASVTTAASRRWSGPIRSPSSGRRRRSQTQPPVARVPGAGARALSACPPTPSCSSASSGSTTPRAFSTACARVDDLLTREPSWKGKLVFIQAAAPTRSRLDNYSALQDEASRLADDINARHGDGDYQPILLSFATTRRTRSMSCSARPMPASSRACMTA